MVYKILTWKILSDHADKSFETFFSTIKSITDRHAPLKKISLTERKLKLKLWSTKGILKSVNNKNKTYRKYCRTKDQNRKHELHTLFKQYRNSLNNIIKVSKANQFHLYFTSNKINLLKVWEGSKEIIHIKPKNKKRINYLRLNDTLCTEQTKIVNSFKVRLSPSKKKFLLFTSMIALQKCSKMLFISSQKLFSFSRYLNFCLDFLGM